MTTCDILRVQFNAAPRRCKGTDRPQHTEERTYFLGWFSAFTLVC